MSQKEKIIYSFAEKIGALNALVEICQGQPEGFDIVLANIVDDLNNLKNDVFEALYITIGGK